MYRIGSSFPASLIRRIERGWMERYNTSCVVGWNNLNRPQRSNVKIGYWKKKENRYDRFCTFLFTGERWLVMSHYFFTSYRDIDWNSNQYRLFNSICWAKKPNSSFPTWECPVSTVDPPGKQMASSLWRLLGDCTLGPALLNGRCWMPEQASWSLVQWWDSLTICKHTRQHRCHIYRKNCSGILNFVYYF